MNKPKPKEPKINPRPSTGSLLVLPEYEIANPKTSASRSQMALNKYSIEWMSYGMAKNRFRKEIKL
ncbi:MAG: hypothetical protein M3R17_07435 [Bacteroidota bacterium]|nr:hypothetical protein [Bacteroidota bacterium]